ncbi:hypothetical protein [Streptomyces clavifer]|uniref:hypothetical protein n=1 Tax=Streptomyces clavifer TaxID=68188 RepID=UPI0033A9B42E
MTSNPARGMNEDPGRGALLSRNGCRYRATSLQVPGCETSVRVPRGGVLAGAREPAPACRGGRWRAPDAVHRLLSTVAAAPP